MVLLSPHSCGLMVHGVSNSTLELHMWVPSGQTILLNKQPFLACLTVFSPNLSNFSHRAYQSHRGVAQPVVMHTSYRCTLRTKVSGVELKSGEFASLLSTR